MDSAPNLVVPCPSGGWVRPTLRSHQEQALVAWRAFGQRGVVCAPAGIGRMRLGVAALAQASGPSVVLCPSKAHAADWARTLARWYAGPVGVVADGEARVEAVTVATFEGAERQAVAIAQKAATFIIDEVHHCCEPPHRELLQRLPHAARLGLTTTASLGRAMPSDRVEMLLGPIVCEVGTMFLPASGAKLESICLRVALDADERAAYERSYRPFAALRSTFIRSHTGASDSTFVRALVQSAAGRRALQGYRRATRVAALPEAKRVLIGALLERHRCDKTLLFTAFDEEALTLAAGASLQLMTSKGPARERRDILASFREGRSKAMVSASLPSEAGDLPDANVAILTAGSLGAREWLERIGQALRPHAGQEALVYELVTARTLDDRRARSRAVCPPPWISS
jgi:superfamily II DNA or RNA helicase